jgi:hypothetical protein
MSKCWTPEFFKTVSSHLKDFVEYENFNKLKINITRLTAMSTYLQYIIFNFKNLERYSQDTNYSELKYFSPMIACMKWKTMPSYSEILVKGH